MTHQTHITFKKLSLVCIAFLTSSSLQAQWDGSGTNTYTLNSNVGIGIGPVIDSKLRIQNDCDPSGILGFPPTPVDLPACIIQRDFYTSGSLPHQPSNIFEIWQQMYSGLSAPITTNSLKFVVDNSGNVAINKPAPGTTFDVGGSANIDDDLTVGNDLTINNNTIIGSDLSVGNNASITADITVGNNANITADLTVGNNASITADLTVGNGATVTGDLVVSSLASGSNRLGVINTSGKVTTQNLPSLSFSSGNLTLSNGGSISSSVTIPSGGDNLGNHTAINMLNMANHDIINVSALDVGSGGIGCSGPIVCGGYQSSGGITMVGNGILINGGFTGLSFTTSVSGPISFNNSINVSGTTYTSDKRFKKNIKPLDDITKRLFSVTSYNYEFDRTQSKYYQFDDKKHFGFIAQEVQNIFPDLVSPIDTEGHLGVQYIEFIPLLLQVLKEEDALVKQQARDIAKQNEMIAELQNKMNALQSIVSELDKNTTGIKESGGTLQSKLEQNIPNPASGTTTIKFSIAGAFHRAFIVIYDLNGKEINKMNIQAGMQEVVIANGALMPAVYTYCLVVDNNLIDTKKMIIAE